MNIKEAYKVMQAQWVEDNDVKVGDTVKVLKSPDNNELGCVCAGHRDTVGNEMVVTKIRKDSIEIEGAPRAPFFCLEKIKSKPHTIAFDGSD